MSLVVHFRSLSLPANNGGGFLSVYFFFLQALQPPSGVVFYSPLAGFSLLAGEVS